MTINSEEIIELQKTKEQCKNFPKIELHAHLNGSLSSEQMIQLYHLKCDQNDHYKRLKLPVILTDEAYPERDGVKVFFELFDFIYHLIDDLTSLKYILLNVLKEFQSDNVIYLELRTTPRSNENMTKCQYIQTVIDTVNEFQSDFNSMVVRLILSINRNDNLESAMETVQYAIQYKDQGVVGVDLCGNPLSGNPTALLPAFQLARDHQLGVTMHVAEIQEDPHTENLMKFLPDRVGHGTFLNYDLPTTKILPIECCLTSNVLCQTVKHYNNHHIHKILDSPYYLPVVCTDDKGIFMSELSEEYEIFKRHVNYDWDQFIQLIQLNLIQSTFINSKSTKLYYNQTNINLIKQNPTDEEKLNLIEINLLNWFELKVNHWKNKYL